MFIDQLLQLVVLLHPLGVSHSHFQETSILKPQLENESPPQMSTCILNEEIGFSAIKDGPSSLHEYIPVGILEKFFGLKCPIFNHYSEVKKVNLIHRTI